MLLSLLLGKVYDQQPTPNYLGCHATYCDERIYGEVIAFNEGRTLPNLLGCLLSRRFPVHASES